jgi:hypothetical protein
MLYPYAYATVACHISKGKISASSWGIGKLKSRLSPGDDD